MTSVKNVGIKKVFLFYLKVFKSLSMRASFQINSSSLFRKKYGAPPPQSAIRRTKYFGGNRFK